MLIPTVFVMCVAFLVGSSYASQETAWSDGANVPLVVNGGVKTASEYYTDTQRQGVAVKMSCSDQTLTSEFEYEINSCWVRADGLRLAASGGHAIKRDNDLHASYTDFDGLVYVAANGSHLFEWVDTETITELRIYKVSSIDFSKVYDDQHTFVEYRIVSPPDRVLQYQDGSSLAGEFFDVFYSLGYFSNNGEWMALVLRDGRLVIVNMHNLTIRTVRARSASGDYFANLAVSNDGRYVAGVVYEEDGRPWVYDLEACGVESITIVSDGTSCSNRWLGYELNQAGAYSNGVTFPASLHFYDEHTLGFYTSSPEPGSGEYWEYIIKAPGTHGRKSYVALGDSFASGEGARSYFSATDWPDVNECHLSTRSYPYLLAKQFPLDSVNSVACSGARIKNIVGPAFIDEKTENDRRTNQYSNVEEEMGYWAPGYKLQQSFLDGGVDVATVSIGGNDIGFGDIISSCVGPGTCFEDVSERSALVATINEQFYRLVDVYTSIKSNMRPGSRVYAVGYPEIIEQFSNKCIGGDVHMNVAERQFAQNVTGYLNYIVELASKRAGVVYINTTEAFYGKRLCEAVYPAVHGLRSAWRWPPFSPESYHPTEQGQRLMAQMIAGKSDNLSAPMPRIDRTAEVEWGGPAAVQYGLMTAEEAAERGHEPYNEIIDFAYPPYQAIARGDTHTGSMQSDEFALVPGANYELWMASTPVHLGTFSANEHSVVNFEVVIPENTVAGRHTFHLRGPTADGRTIDIRQPIYVAATIDDWDGDGIPNDEAPCYVALENDDGALDHEWCENKRTVRKVQPLAPIGYEDDNRSTHTLKIKPLGTGNGNDFSSGEIEGQKQPYDRDVKNGAVEVRSNSKRILLIAVTLAAIAGLAILVSYKHKRR